MKKGFILLFVLVLMLSTLTACGGSADSASNDNLSAPATTEPTSDNNSSDNGQTEPAPSGSNTSKVDPNQKITKFSEDFQQVKDPIWDLIDQQDVQPGITLKMMPIISSDMVMALLPGYDLIDGKGQLVLSGDDAFKEEQGNVVTFGSEHINDQAGYYDKGDVTTTSGKLDLGKGELYVEELTKHADGTLFERHVYELALLSDGTYVGQYFKIRDGKSSSYLFTHMKKNIAEFVVAKGDKNVNHEYTTILGAGDVSAADMAAGYDVELTVKVADGKVTFEPAQ